MPVFCSPFLLCIMGGTAEESTVSESSNAVDSKKSGNSKMGTFFKAAWFRVVFPFIIAAAAALRFTLPSAIYLLGFLLVSTRRKINTTQKGLSIYYLISLDLNYLRNVMVFLVVFSAIATFGHLVVRSSSVSQWASLLKHQKAGGGGGKKKENLMKKIWIL